MERPLSSRLRLSRSMALLQLAFCSLVVLVGVANFYRFHSVGIFLHMDADAAMCSHFHAKDGVHADRVEAVLDQLAALQLKLETTVQMIDKNRELRAQRVPRSEFQRFVEEEVIQPLRSAHARLQVVRLVVPRVEESMQDPLVDFFAAEEARRYLTSRETRRGEESVYGANLTRATIGHACVLVKEELEEYMSYEVASDCKDDWLLGRRLVARGCDPLPRRRCLARAPHLPQRPPLSDEKEQLRWVAANASGSQPVDFLIRDVLAVKPRGEIRIGLDASVGAGVFAERMREWGVTVVPTALDAGVDFSNAIAQRGLVPLQANLNQRLPFFDNTMDLIHTTGLLDGQVDLHRMDLVLFDWDRVLRPGGLLWVDRFVCDRKRLDDYSYMLQQFRYQKHKWVVSPKSGDDVYLSALLEKPPRSL